MKNLSFSLLIAGAAAAGLVSLSSCKKNSSSPPPPSTHITSFSPATAPMNSMIVIRGTGFDPNTSGTQVSFGGKAAVVMTATDTMLTVKVPVGAPDGKIHVQASAGSDSTSTDF